MIGDPTSLDWLIAEGETDGARLYGLVGDRCADPGPAHRRAARSAREWADAIPRGATVALCHDADEDGDAGAEKAAQIIGGGTVRVRPPIEGGDWCDWPGTAEEFVKLARPRDRFEFVELRRLRRPRVPGRRAAARRAGQGVPRRRVAVDGLRRRRVGQVDVHDRRASCTSPPARTGSGSRCPGRCACCLVENEGPPGLFQQKLAAKLDSWEGADPRDNLFVYAAPWGEFTFADPEARAALTAFCDEHRIDVVAANPTLGLGVGTVGPTRRDAAVRRLARRVRPEARPRVLAAAPREQAGADQSGDWGRHPDTNVLLQRDGNRQRTKLTWVKTRWATLEPDEKAVALEWVVDGQGYTVVALDAVGVSRRRARRAASSRT